MIGLGRMGANMARRLLAGGHECVVFDMSPKAVELARKDIHYVDVGTSGGVWGRERGYCLMIGGEAAVVKVSEFGGHVEKPGHGDGSPR
jgi:6-phosphogluconate dehydrogenase